MLISCRIQNELASNTTTTWLQFISFAGEVIELQAMRFNTNRKSQLGQLSSGQQSTNGSFRCPSSGTILFNMPKPRICPLDALISYRSLLENHRQICDEFKQLKSTWASESCHSSDFRLKLFWTNKFGRIQLAKTVTASPKRIYFVPNRYS